MSYARKTPGGGVKAKDPILFSSSISPFLHYHTRSSLVVKMQQASLHVQLRETYDILSLYLDVALHVLDSHGEGTQAPL